MWAVKQNDLLWKLAGDNDLRLAIANCKALVPNSAWVVDQSIQKGYSESNPVTNEYEVTGTFGVIDVGVLSITINGKNFTGTFVTRDANFGDFSATEAGGDAIDGEVNLNTGVWSGDYTSNGETAPNGTLSGTSSIDGGGAYAITSGQASITSIVTTVYDWVCIMFYSITNKIMMSGISEDVKQIKDKKC